MKQFLLILTCIVIIQGMCLAGPVVSLVDGNDIECLENGPDKKKKQSSDDSEEDSEDLEEEENEEIEDEDAWEDDSTED